MRVSSNSSIQYSRSAMYKAFIKAKWWGCWLDQVWSIFPASELLPLVGIIPMQAKWIKLELDVNDRPVLCDREYDHLKVSTDGAFSIGNCHIWCCCIFLYLKVQQKVRDYTKIRHLARDKKGSGGQQPTHICTFPRGKRVYLFPKIHDALNGLAVKQPTEDEDLAEASKHRGEPQDSHTEKKRQK